MTSKPTCSLFRSTLPREGRRASSTSFAPLRRFDPCLSLLFISSGSPTDPSAPAGNALFTAKEARCFPETSFGFVCLPSVRHSARQGVLASPWLSRWRLHRHTRTLKRNPVVFRPRAARTDDGARRPAETPRSFRCRRAEPIAPRECPCPAKDAFGTGGNNRGTKQGSVSDAAHSRRSRGSGTRASRCRSGVPLTDSATGFVAL